MIYLLDQSNPRAPFPDPALAETEPNGLLAIGGDLTVGRLLNAYRQGIFPWFSAGQPMLWWSPDPRMVLATNALIVSHSLRKTLRRGGFAVSMDLMFEEVTKACAAPRSHESGTWLVPEMMVAYGKLHRLGYAHSVEAWQDGELVGGLYGVAIGRIFFGESMFSRVSNASKVALAFLVERLRTWHFDLIDCQVYSEHLESLGAREISRDEFQQALRKTLAPAVPSAQWRHPPTATATLDAANH